MFNAKVFALTACLLVIACEGKPYRGGFNTARQSSFIQPAASYQQSVRAARQAADEPKPEPYSFTYETTDEYGMTLTRTESGDANGNVKGSYMYRDPEGIYRTVEYGDNGDGFTAQIQTNEPGVISHKAADAEYFKN